MINQKELWQDFVNLPGSAQQVIVELIGLLKTGTASESSVRKANGSPLAEDSFVGMWKDRVDLADSSQWVRDLRSGDW